jgi:hypothetical protein
MFRGKTRCPWHLASYRINLVTSLFIHEERGHRGRIFFPLKKIQIAAELVMASGVQLINPCVTVVPSAAWRPLHFSPLVKPSSRRVRDL